MITRIIEWSLKNRFLVLCGVLMLIVLGVRAVFKTPVDAIPDLTENQVLVYADWMGRSPQEVEDQVTFPLSTGLQGLAGVKDVRATSMFGFSLITIIFEEGVDTYFARTRVLERLNYLQANMPEGVKPQLGPDATGLGWVYQYYLAVDPAKAGRGDAASPHGGSDAPVASFDLRDGGVATTPMRRGVAATGGYDLGKLRALQDWFIRYQLASVQGVAEVASIGGFVKQYQIELSSTKMRAANVSLGEVMGAVQNANLNVGGKVIEENGAEFVLRGIGLVASPEDLELIAVKAVEGTPIYLKDIATVQIGGDFRRGALDINGAEAVGGTVVMRTGENAKAVIERVKARIAEIAPSLPPGISIKPFYDRSTLIDRTIDTLKHALIEEIILVTLAHIIFLWHFRSILIVTLPLPISILISFLLMKEFGITSNIMSLTGIAIAIGVLVDAAIVVTENVIRHCERAEEEKQTRRLAGRAGSPLPAAGGSDDGAHGVTRPTNEDRLTAAETWAVTLAACKQVGRPIFFAMAIIILAFVPVFALTGQEGKLFHPLAWTKTFAMVGSTLLAVTVVPVLCSLLVRGPFHSEDRNIIMRVLLKIYDPVLNWALNHRKTVIGAAAALLAAALLVAFGLPRAAVVRLANILTPSPAEFSLINTGLQSGDSGRTNMETVSTVSAARETAEAVEDHSRAANTRLKPGVNERHANEHAAAREAEALRRFAAQYPRLANLIQGFGKEFMPPLNEGSLLYMPVLLPKTSLAEIQRVMAWQDQVMAGVPEIETVAGKAGRFETPTDPAPTEMLETTITLKPEWISTNRTVLGFIKLPRVVRNPAWREGMTVEKLKAELTEKMKVVPGYVPAFLQPIENRILMLYTGIRAQVGVKIYGDNLDALQQKAFEVEALVKMIPGAAGVSPSRVQGKPYLNVKVDRRAMARYGLSARDVLDAVEVGIGGKNVSVTIEGRERYPIQVRLERGERDDIEKIGRILIATRSGMGNGTDGADATSGGGGMDGSKIKNEIKIKNEGAYIPLAMVATITREVGANEIASENGRLRAYVQANVQDRDLGGFVNDVEAALKKMDWGSMTYQMTGEYENQRRFTQTMQVVFPTVMLIIFIMLYMVYHSAAEAAHVLLAVPFALSGGVFLQKLLGYNFNGAVWVGYIALFGTAVQTGVVMVVYLEETLKKRMAERGDAFNATDLIQAVKDGARLRLRPKVMTVATIVASLLPIMWSHRQGAEVMKPLATPVIGGMISSLIHILIVTPVIFAWLRERELRKPKRHSIVPP